MKQEVQRVGTNGRQAGKQINDHALRSLEEPAFMQNVSLQAPFKQNVSLHATFLTSVSWQAPFTQNVSLQAPVV